MWQERSRIATLAFSSLLFLAIPSLSNAQAAPPVIPGASGFGMQTPAGRGGTVIRVNTLDGSGAGSLRAAINASGPRIIVFDVSGIIDLGTGSTNISNPYVTIAGQTAPSPGILIRGHLVVSTHDVLIQHIAIRPGHIESHYRCGRPTINDPQRACTRDAIDIDASANEVLQNVVIDHVSASWSVDELTDTWAETGRVHDITIRNSIFAEPLRLSNHPDGAHAFGVYFGPGTDRVAFLQNVLAFNEGRNPHMADATDLVIVDNLIHRPGTSTLSKIDFAPVYQSEVPLRAAVEGNVVFGRSGNASQAVNIRNGIPSSFSLYLDNNRTFNPGGGAGTWYPPGQDPWHSSIVDLNNNALGNVRATQRPIWVDDLTLLSGDIENRLLMLAGARAADRDPVDKRIIAKIKSGTGDYINTPADVGGYPNLALNTRTIPLPADPSGDADGDVYTNLEEWLHELAFELEGDQRVMTAENFSGSLSGWHMDSDASTWSIVTDGTGVLNQSSTTTPAQAFRKGTYFYNQTVEAKVKVTSFNGDSRFARVYARYRDPNNAYYVTIRNNSATGGVIELRKLEQGTAIALTSAPLSVFANDWYSVRLSVAGGKLYAKVRNLTRAPFDEATLSYVDTNPLPTGYAAVGTYLASARFDDVIASPFGGATPQLSDTFEDNTATDWSFTNGSWSVVTNGSRVYRQSATTAPLQARSSWNTPVADASQAVQADVRPLSFGGSSFVSVHARYVDPDNNYYVTLRNTKVFELKKVSGGTVVLSTAVTLPTDFDLLASHTLRIETTGTNPTRLKGYLDGVPLLYLTDDAPITAANKAAVGTNAATADFDNVIVTAPY